MYFTRIEKNEFTNEKFVSTISSETAIEEMRDLFHSCDFDYCEQKNAILFVKSDLEIDGDEFKYVSIKFEPILDTLPTLKADRQ